jgi:hypothetical protein
MKKLIAVMGAELHAVNGMQQLNRETWAQDISLLGDYKFFIGNGPSDDGIIRNISLKEDEVRLNVPDDKAHLLYKVIATLRWALDHGYDRILKTCTDTYSNIPSLVHENLDADYIGAPVGTLGQIYAGTNCYGFLQGSSTWFSAKAAEIIIKDAIPTMNRVMPEAFKYNGLICPYPHSDDLWEAQALTPYLWRGEIKARSENGYTNGPLTYHFGYNKEIPYWSEKFDRWMRGLYANRNNITEMNYVHERRID